MRRGGRREGGVIIVRSHIYKSAIYIYIYIYIYIFKGHAAVFAIYGFCLMESAQAHELVAAYESLGRHFLRSTVINLQSSPHFLLSLLKLLLLLLADDLKGNWR